MGKIRLGKRERAERKAQWSLVKEAKASLIKDNLNTPKSAIPTSKGYRTVNVMEGYTFHGASNMVRPDNQGRDKGYAKQRY